jgi:hypothetical protein
VFDVSDILFSLQQEVKAARQQLEQAKAAYTTR